MICSHILPVSPHCSPLCLFLPPLLPITYLPPLPPPLQLLSAQVPEATPAGTVVIPATAVPKMLAQLHGDRVGAFRLVTMGGVIISSGNTDNSGNGSGDGNGDGSGDGSGGGSSVPLAVDGRTGAIFLTRPLDYETAPSVVEVLLEFNVTNQGVYRFCDDVGWASYETVVRVHVLDVGPELPAVRPIAAPAPRLSYVALGSSPLAVDEELWRLDAAALNETWQVLTREGAGAGGTGDTGDTGAWPTLAQADATALSLKLVPLWSIVRVTRDGSGGQRVRRRVVE